MTSKKRDVYAFAREIMKAHGATCTPDEFHRAVNSAFHEMEAPLYDDLHEPLWASLPQQVKALVDDVVLQAGSELESIRLLDIGCGTGMATELLLGTELGPKIASIDGLDTSLGMLRKYAERSKRWSVQPQLHQGEVSDLPAGKQFDLIIACSVLHHIPDLSGFLAGVQSHQAPGGFWLHLQDPNGDYADDRELASREQQCEASAAGQRKPHRRSLIARMWRRLKRQFATPGLEDVYLERTNRLLMQRKIITTPLSAPEIWTITDVHIYNKEGISLKRMAQVLEDYELVRSRSYAFFGKLWSELSPDFQRREEELTRQFAPNGKNVCASWRRTAADPGQEGLVKSNV